MNCNRGEMKPVRRDATLYFRKYAVLLYVETQKLWMPFGITDRFLSCLCVDDLKLCLVYFRWAIIDTSIPYNDLRHFALHLNKSERGLATDVVLCRWKTTFFGAHHVITGQRLTTQTTLINLNKGATSIK